MLLTDYRESILALAGKYHAGDVRVFGSVIRNEDSENSDLDLLVKWDKDASLTDLTGLKIELEAMLGCKVDIASEKSLHWYIKDKVLSEAKPL